MVNFNEVFAGMNVTEMKEALKALNTEAKTFIKEVETAEKEAVVKNAKENMKEGDTVTVKYKDGTITGIVVAMRDKTFTLETEDVLNFKGEASKIARNYNLVVG